MDNKKCEKCSNEERKTYRDENSKETLIKRLNIIEGQVRGVNQMIKDDRYCYDVLIQISAINKALQSLGNNILENHLKSCVIEDIKKDKLDAIDDVMELIKKLQ